MNASTAPKVGGNYCSFKDKVLESCVSPKPLPLTNIALPTVISEVVPVLSVTWVTAGAVCASRWVVGAKTKRQIIASGAKRICSSPELYVKDKIIYKENCDACVNL
jgi:hypothetical protein